MRHRSPRLLRRQRPRQNQLNQLVGRIALYPDPLLAHVLTASTYGDQIPDADAWADQHSNLRGDALANAIREDNLPWDSSVLALLPLPSVLDMMAHDPQWTQELGNAVLGQRADIMDAVQRMRKQARQYGYLRSTPYDQVVDSVGELKSSLSILLTSMFQLTIHTSFLRRHALEFISEA